MSTTLFHTLQLVCLWLLLPNCFINGAAPQNRNNRVPTKPISCYVCGVSNHEPDCVKKGRREQCTLDQVCFSEVRVENGIYRQTHSCKQRKACTALESENYFHCEAGLKPPCPQGVCQPRLCRKCCWNEDFCNLKSVLPDIGVSKASFDSKPGSGPKSRTVSSNVVLKSKKLTAGLMVLLPEWMEATDIFKPEASNEE